MTRSRQEANLDYESLAECIEREGGFTVNLNGLPPTGGYVVAVHPGDDVVIPLRADTDLADAIYLFVIDHGGELREPKRFIGAWKDGDRVVLDVVEVFKYLSDAIYVGGARGQDAIWDVFNSREVRVGDDYAALTTADDRERLSPRELDDHLEHDMF